MLYLTTLCEVFSIFFPSNYPVGQATVAPHLPRRPTGACPALQNTPNRICWLVRAGCATSLLGCLIWPTGGPVDRLCFLLTRQRDQNPNNFPTCFCLLFSTLYWKYCWKGQCHEKGLAFYQMSCCFRSKQWTAKWFYTCFRSSAKCYRISTLFLIVVLSCS